ncbi:hypothetical protein BH10PSE1_BH10PSE1_23560 [soil metagenome]
MTVRGCTHDDYLEELVEGSPAMLWRGDASGSCVYLSRSMREFWGLAPEDVPAFQWASSLLEDDQAAVFGPFETGMKLQTDFVCEGRYRRADGEVRTLQTRARPYMDPQNRFLGMVGVNEDITELRAAEQQLQQRDAEKTARLDELRAGADRFALATRVSGLAMSEHDAQLRYTWSHNLPPECLGKTPAEFVGPDLGAPLENILREALTTGVSQSREVSFRMGERRIWCDIQASASTLGNGEPGLVASALDVTARKLNEEKLEVLARELSHRVKNVFAVVQAIVRQSAKAANAPAAFVGAVDARLKALADAQDTLLSMSDDRVSMDALLRQQLSHLVLDHNVEFDGPEVLLPGRLAPYLALAVHELGTNALKHGALSVPRGKVSVHWTRSAPERVSLSWVETGGPTVKAGNTSGFGSVLLTKVAAAALGGSTSLRLEASGLEWEAVFPITLDLRTD